MMTEVLKAVEISKSFPGVRAVDRVSLALERGEVLVLLGENGAGKTTLTQVLGGALKQDEGHIYLEGEEVFFYSPEDAIRCGISMVFQELSLVGSLSVAENIFADRQPVGRLNNIRWGELYRQTEDFLSRFELDIEPKALVKRLSMGQQQILEILKAISTDPKVLILDEPTSSLTEAETAYLFQNIRKLQARGISIIYITHKLSEIFQIASRVLVMRDGRCVGSKMVGEVTENDLVSMMVGRQITNLYGVTEQARSCASAEEYFCVEGLNRRGVFHDISFHLKRGEILGFAGLVGAGRTEVGHAIFGLTPKDSGRIILNGRELKINQPEDAIRNGIAYITEDRKGQGLFTGMTVQENMIAPSMKSFATSLDFLNRRLIEIFAKQMISEFSIVTPSVHNKVINLSGGNQQKCLIAMWTGIRPEVIIFDEPTRGVDVGARADIYQKLREFAAQGTGIIMISSDLPEIIGMCDRILVMHQGRVSGEVLPDQFTEEHILALAAGLNGALRYQILPSNYWEKLTQIARPVLQALSKNTPGVIHLAVLEGSEIICLDTVNPPPKRKNGKPVAQLSSVPFCNSLKEVLLAWAPDEIITPLRKKMVQSHKYSRPDELDRAMQQIRKTGMHVEMEKTGVEYWCIAVAIRDLGGKGVAAISISGQGEAVGAEDLEKWKRLAQEAADHISGRFRYQAS